MNEGVVVLSDKTICSMASFELVQKACDVTPLQPTRDAWGLVVQQLMRELRAAEAERDRLAAELREMGVADG